MKHKMGFSPEEKQQTIELLRKYGASGRINWKALREENPDTYHALISGRKNGDRALNQFMQRLRKKGLAPKPRKTYTKRAKAVEVEPSGEFTGPRFCPDCGNPLTPYYAVSRIARARRMT